MEDGVALGTAEMLLIHAALRTVSSEAGGTLLYQTVTRSGPWDDPMMVQLVPVATELAGPTAATDFQRRNRTPRRIEGAPDLAPSVQPIGPAAAEDALASLAAWQALRERAPGLSGVVSISRPGIDDSGARAILLVEMRCGPGCGNGRVLSFERSADGWRLAASRSLWVG